MSHKGYHNFTKMSAKRQQNSSTRRMSAAFGSNEKHQNRSMKRIQTSVVLLLSIIYLMSILSIRTKSCRFAHVFRRGVSLFSFDFIIYKQKLLRRRMVCLRGSVGEGELGSIYPKHGGTEGKSISDMITDAIQM